LTIERSFCSGSHAQQTQAHWFWNAVKSLENKGLSHQATATNGIFASNAAGI